MSELSQLMLYHDLTLRVVAALEAKDSYTTDFSTCQRYDRADLLSIASVKNGNHENLYGGTCT